MKTVIKINTQVYILYNIIYYTKILLVNFNDFKPLATFAYDGTAESENPRHLRCCLRPQHCAIFQSVKICRIRRVPKDANNFAQKNYRKKKHRKRTNRIALLNFQIDALSDRHNRIRPLGKLESNTIKLRILFGKVEFALMKALSFFSLYVYRLCSKVK